MVKPITVALLYLSSTVFAAELKPEKPFDKQRGGARPADDEDPAEDKRLLP